MAELKTLTIKNVLTKYNFTDKNDINRNEFIVVHYFGGLGTARSVADYFAGSYVGASAHLNLDEGKTVYRSVEDGDIAWHCGTSGIYYHPKCRNSNSIGIEVRPYILDKSQSNNAAYRGWYFSQEIEDNLIELVKYLMEKYNIDIDHVIRHYDVTHKYCPRPYMGDDINLHYGVSGNSAWKKFKTRLKESIDNEQEDEDMTDAKFKELMDKYRSELKDNDCGTWSDEARKWSIEQGLFVGGGNLPNGESNYMWEDLLTREQAAQVLFRFAKLMGKAQ